MKVVALISGGKDSCYSVQLCTQYGHEVVALANLLPEESAPDELDSYMYQTVGHQLVDAYAACTGVPLFRKRITGTSTAQELGYMPTQGDEVEDLLHLLAYVKESMPQVQAVASGAIASDYQRLRVENVCTRLNLVSLAYLWHQPQRALLRGMVESGIQAILVKVACLGLSPHKHLGRTIADLEPLLLQLCDRYGCNVCGEGGEYETLTLDCPMFTRGRIVLHAFEVVMSGSDAGHLVPTSFRIEPKAGWEGMELPSDVRHVPRDHPTPAPKVPTFARLSAGVLLGPGAGADALLAGPAPSASAAAGAAGGKQELPDLPPLSMAPVITAFGVQLSMRAGRDYVQLACRAVRSMPALASDFTESDTTAALHLLLTAAQQELTRQGLDLNHGLFVHLYLAHMGHFQAANAVYCRHFPQKDPPSRACVQVPLPPDCPVMCELLLARGAFRPGSSNGFEVPHHSRKVLHVQSISAWAPSCIGPYSQCTSYRGLAYLAGCIPLDPPNMVLVQGDITAQVLRTMASCEAVAVAQRSSCVRAALGLTVYLLASSSGGGGSASVSGGGAPGGGGMGPEARAQAKALLESLLEHGLPPAPDLAHALGHSGAAGGGPFTRRGSQVLGLDEPDEREEAEQRAGGPAAQLDSYLQPPEVKAAFKPSVVYLEVAALPRGSLLEVQPVCMDVETLALLRRLSGQDSGRRRPDAGNLSSSALASDLPPVTPTGSSNAHSPTALSPVQASGISARAQLPSTSLPWLMSTGDNLADAASQHFANLSLNRGAADNAHASRPRAASHGPNANDAAGGARGGAGGGLDVPGGSAGVGLGFGTGRGPGLRSFSEDAANGVGVGGPGVAPWLDSHSHEQAIHLPPSPFGPQQHTLARVSSSGLDLEPDGGGRAMAPSRSSTSGSGSGSTTLDSGGGSQRSSSGLGLGLGRPSKGMVGARASRSSESGLLERPAGADAPPPHNVYRTSLSGLPASGGFSGAAAAAAAPAGGGAFGSPAAARVSGEGGGAGPPAGAESPTTRTSQHRNLAAPSRSGDGGGGGSGRLVRAASCTVGSLGTSGAALAKPATVPLPGATGPPTATPGGSSSSSSNEVMVTSVCSYGLVLRSLFHLKPSIFAPGVTRAQLTRRFRRAASAVLAAHSMDLSQLISARVWYCIGRVDLADDEYDRCVRVSASGLHISHAVDEAPLDGDGAAAGVNGAPGPQQQQQQPAPEQRQQGGRPRSSGDFGATADSMAFHVTWVPVVRVSTNSAQECVAVLELLASAS